VSLRSLLDRALVSRSELEAHEEHREVLASGCTPVGRLRPRQRVRVTGVLRSVTVRPRQGVRAFVAELYDGTGAVRLVFLGRRSVPGLVAGRHVLAEGLVAQVDGENVLFNPRYELKVVR